MGGKPSLEDLLRAATVRVEGGPRPGAGFFVAPGLVLTCVHVIGTEDRLCVYSAAPGVPVETAVEEVVWRLHDQGRPLPALDENYPDLALLRVGIDGPQCVAVDTDWPLVGDHCQMYGFPDEGGAQRQLTPALLSCRGRKGNDPTVFIDLAADTVRPGMSGGPLLNLRTRRVCGIVVATRSPATPDGGLAVPMEALGDRLPELLAGNRRYHDTHPRWTIELRQDARPVRFGLPRLVPHFTGRAHELEKLEQALERGDRAMVTQAVTGLGGVGKTQLAAAYVHRHLRSYDIVAWIRADNGGVGDLAALAVALGVPLRAGLTTDERATAVLHWLDNCDQSWLLVIDNVADPEQFAALSPTSGNGRVLATSRHQGLDQFGPVLRVDVLDADAGEEYLVARCGRPNDRAAARRVATALGGLPLALSHAAAYCSQGTSFDDYLTLLELPAAEVFDTSPEVFYRRTVASTWQVSIVAAATAAPLARPILAMASYLAPDKIPTALFDVLLDRPEDLRERKTLADGVHALNLFSLAEAHTDNLSVHRLLQKIVRDDADARNDTKGAVLALDVLVRTFPVDPVAPAWWPQCEQLLAHVLALFNALEARPKPVDGAVASAMYELLDRGCNYLLAAGGGKRAVTVTSTTAKWAEQVLGAEHPYTIAAQNHLATAHWTAGQTGEAITVGEQVLASDERILGADNPHTLNARHNLAAYYRFAGRIGEAIVIQRRVIAEHQRVLGVDHPGTLMSRGSLAGSYLVAGRTREAMAIDEELLADCLRVLGPDHHFTLAVRSDLACVSSQVELTGEAISALEKVLDDRERILGAHHPGTLETRNNLAFVYSSAGRTEEAIAIQEPVLAERERVLGADHHDTLVAANNLAVSYRLAGRIGEAITLHEATLAGCERVLGADHPQTLTAASTLAVAYRSAGRIAEAVPLEEGTLAGIERAKQQVFVPQQSLSRRQQRGRNRLLRMYGMQPQVLSPVSKFWRLWWTAVGLVILLTILMHNGLISNTAQMDVNVAGFLLGIVGILGSLLARRRPPHK